LLAGPAFILYNSLLAQSICEKPPRSIDLARLVEDRHIGPATLVSSHLRIAAASSDDGWGQCTLATMHGSPDRHWIDIGCGTGALTASVLDAGASAIISALGSRSRPTDPSSSSRAPGRSADLAGDVGLSPLTI